MTVFSCSAPRFEISELATEMACLSSEAVDEANRDLFGLGEPSPENESTFSALQRLDEALCCIDEKPELIQATNMCPDYVNSQEFRLMFLRSENLNADKAAQRMVVYWSEKVKIFGSEKAYRPLTIDDLEPNDVRVIEDGGVIALPEKDEKGRGLIFTDITKWNNQAYVMNRVAFYVAHTLLEDVEVQRQGVVFLRAYTPSFSIEHFDRKVNNRMMKTFHSALQFASLEPILLATVW
ncbi:hypothetical protein MHU86_24853 [Fragilaria crotonensis]|nr:hypothetical protein MHU86_24853 [Fragilaria crotonensis]